MNVRDWHCFYGVLCLLLLATARARNWPWVWRRRLRRESGEVYMDRWQLLKSPILSVYINRINMPDYDRWLHNHPWRRAYSLKLGRKSYTEQVLWPGANSEAVHYLEELGIYAYRRPGRWSRIPELHRIHQLDGGGPVWTLFIGIGRKRPWGFRDPSTGEVMPAEQRKAERGVTNEGAS